VQLITTAVLLLSGVGVIQAATVAKPAKAAVGTSDATIEQDLRARLARSKISKDNFQVKVQNGTAVITGRTDVIQHKGVATRLAKSAGARRIDNRVEISDAARKAAVSNLERARRRGELKRSEVTRATAP
jgi:osmotically-inducible protein OsmY